MPSEPAQKERRRIDLVKEPEFSSDLEKLTLKDLRTRRDLASDVETELSFYRRLLHGRMDLLAFEQRRRRGEESRTMIDALPEILTGHDHPRGQARHLSTEVPELPIKGRRHLDRILGNDLMIRLAELTEQDLVEASEELAEVEAEISALRLEIQIVLDRLQAAVVTRYKNDLGDPALHST